MRPFTLLVVALSPALTLAAAVARQVISSSAVASYASSGHPQYQSTSTGPSWQTASPWDGASAPSAVATVYASSSPDASTAYASSADVTTVYACPSATGSVASGTVYTSSATGSGALGGTSTIASVTSFASGTPLSVFGGGTSTGSSTATFNSTTSNTPAALAQAAGKSAGNAVTVNAHFGWLSEGVVTLLSVPFAL